MSDRVEAAARAICCFGNERSKQLGSCCSGSPTAPRECTRLATMALAAADASVADGAKRAAEELRLWAKHDEGLSVRGKTVLVMTAALIERMAGIKGENE